MKIHRLIESNIDNILKLDTGAKEYSIIALDSLRVFMEYLELFKTVATKETLFIIEGISKEDFKNLTIYTDLKKELGLVITNIEDLDGCALTMESLSNPVLNSKYKEVLDLTEDKKVARDILNTPKNAKLTLMSSSSDAEIKLECMLAIEYIQTLTID